MKKKKDYRIRKETWTNGKEWFYVENIVGGDWTTVSAHSTLKEAQCQIDIFRGNEVVSTEIIEY